MISFDYKAVKSNGDVQEGRMEADSRETVVAKIQLAGQIPIRVEETILGLSQMDAPSSEKLTTIKVSQQEVLTFTQSLSALLHAGVVLDRALEIMIQVEENQQIRQVTEDIQKAVREGSPLSQALENQGDAFSRFFINMIHTAEASGSLDKGLARLADYMQNSKALRDKVVSALIYPTILLVVASISLMIILTYVVPQFAPLFEDMGDALPASTQFILSLAEAVQEYGWMGLIAAAGLGLMIKMQLSNVDQRSRIDGVLLNTPMVGALIKKLEMARFSRSLGTLLEGGVPLLNSLAIAKETVSNSLMVKDIEVAVANLKEGGQIADSLIASGHFPRLGLQMIKVGEESANLDEMLLQVADRYDGEVSIEIQRLLMVLEPILIVGLGVAIAGIIISVLVGIVSINDLPM